MKFEWDDEKNRINKAKHGISFELAMQVWLDDNRLLVSDSSAPAERRWHAIGLLRPFTIVVAVHTYRGTEDQETVRIISARKATPRERRRYQSGNDS